MFFTSKLLSPYTLQSCTFLMSGYALVRQKQEKPLLASEYETWLRHYEDENYGQGVFPYSELYSPEHLRSARTFPFPLAHPPSAGAKQPHVEALPLHVEALLLHAEALLLHLKALLLSLKALLLSLKALLLYITTTVTTLDN